MPTNRDLTDKDRDIFSGGAGTTADTKSKKITSYKSFVQYVFQKEEIVCDVYNLSEAQLEEVVENYLSSTSDYEIGRHFIEYFQTMQVAKREKKEDGSFTVTQCRPKKKYAEALKSHIKMSFLERHKLDLSDMSRFPEERSNWSGFLKVLKSEGDHFYCNI